MGKGIGKTQLAIIEQLKIKGKPLTVADVAWYIWDSGVNNVGDTVPRSLVESVRRGAKSLEKRGEVKTGYSHIRGNKEEFVLFVWLPETSAPYRAERISGATVESAVLMALKQYKSDTRRGLSYSARRIIAQVYPSYMHSWKQYPAIHRAIKRLVAAGKIKREVVHTGYKWEERFLSVEL